ncbi:MAG: FKBP-type peptidyl-prolyl cis-trans isomerase [Bacteroidota bacterium]|nr:FKBP-type peptidyl-prolyl cis-trans isomerase [Bacteroidota bacterium]
MNKSIFLAAAAMAILAAGCADQKFKKAPDGSEYKLFKNESGKKAVKGNVLELNIIVKYKDSLIFSSFDNGMPRFVPFDTATLPPFFKEVNEGDSLVMRQSTDTIMKSGQGAPWMAKGEFIYQTFKVAKVFTDAQSADSTAKAYAPAAKAKAYKNTVATIEKDMAKNADQMKKDDQQIQAYLTKNNIKASKTPWGTYVSITTPGSGPNITQNDVAVMKYTGKTFGDSAFDSNTDPKFGHVEPLYVDMGEFRVLPGWIDGLKMMQKGSKGQLIIPSFLAYGKRGSPPKIGPDENLVFDVEVTDIVSQDQYQKEMEAKQNAMQQQQQEMMQQQMQKQQQQQPNGGSKPPVNK